MEVEGARMSTASKVAIGRMSVRVALEKKIEIDRVAARYGVKRGTFYAMAISLGTRHLAAQIEPEKMLTPELVEMIGAYLTKD